MALRCRTTPRRSERCVAGPPPPFQVRLKIMMRIHPPSSPQRAPAVPHCARGYNPCDLMTAVRAGRHGLRESEAGADASRPPPNSHAGLWWRTYARAEANAADAACDADLEQKLARYDEPTPPMTFVFADGCTHGVAVLGETFDARE
ncbi:hypothetical protein BJY52DRAFT_1194051 [Lactarius psammicola]|nr:hypothetical protein BJY52DRAFT_1194051 [Lactarius psammicola]